MIVSDFCSELEIRASRATPEDRKIICSLLSAIHAWGDSPDPVKGLVDALDRTLGHSWFSHDGMHADVARLIDEVRAEAVRLPGMTMNERLFAFGLMEAWDCASEATRTDLRRKLEAT